MKNNINIGEGRKKGLKTKFEDAILVGVVHKDQTLHQVEEYLDELEFLAKQLEQIPSKGIFKNESSRFQVLYWKR